MPHWLQWLTSLKSLLSASRDSRVAPVAPEQARELLASEQGLQIMDVRQPKEYRKGHLPGAHLMPVAELDQTIDELSQDQPVLVYCASGGRSTVAAHMLAGKGFKRVLNLTGGFKAWNGWTGYGDYELGLEAFSESMSLEQTLGSAYAMEAALEGFYREMAETVTAPEAADLFRTLADVEVSHKNAVARRMHKAGVHSEESDLRDTPEGGMALEDHMRRMGVDLNQPEDVVDFAMAVEAQALDLYSRAALQAQGDTRAFLEAMASEEKGHLRLLGDLLERTPTSDSTP